MRTQLTVPPDHLLPDEDPSDYEALRADLLAELCPRGAFQARVAGNIVDVEWDILRHRRLLASLLRTEFKRQAAGVSEDGLPGRAPGYLRGPELVECGHLLLEGDEGAHEEIAEFGVTVSEITAAAQVAQAGAVAYHESRIADLERRRRHLMSDLERLQAWAARHAEIDDAETVE